LVFADGNAYVGLHWGFHNDMKTLIEATFAPNAFTFLSKPFSKPKKAKVNFTTSCTCTLGEQNQKNAVYYNQRGRFHLSLSRPEHALSYMMEAYRLDPENEVYREDYFMARVAAEPFTPSAEDWMQHDTVVRHEYEFRNKKAWWTEESKKWQKKLIDQAQQQNTPLEWSYIEAPPQPIGDWGPIELPHWTGPYELESVNNLAAVLNSQGKYEEAEAMHRQTLARMEKVLGHEHLHTLTSIHCLAHLLTHRRRYNEALALYEKACAGYQAVLGKDHSTTRACYQHHADALVLQERDQFGTSPTIPDGSPIARTEKGSKLLHGQAKIVTQKTALKPVPVSSMRGGLSEVERKSTSNDVLNYPEQRWLPHERREDQQLCGAESTHDNSDIHHGQRHRGVVSAPLDLLEMMRDNLEYREVYGSGPVWTYTSSEDVSIENIPLRISGHPVVIPVEYRHPAAAYTTPPPDPRHLFIDASKDVSEDIVNDIFETYNNIVGFYLLINGMLQLIIPEDFDIENALSCKPNEFGSLKVSYIHQSIIPTAESQEGTFSGCLLTPLNVEAVASQRTQCPHPLQVSDYTNMSSKHGKSRDISMDLKIGSMVHVCLEGLKAADRFQGKIGLMTESNGQNHMVIPTHILTRALMATKSDRFPGDQWKDDIVVVASSGGREV
jgi:tetratricopeptide (TPR) repeat protein